MLIESHLILSLSRRFTYTVLGMSNNAGELGAYHKLN
jgi:hypothetical protein